MRFTNIAKAAISLKGHNAFIAGGCGIVGSGIVKNLAQTGAKCWVSARNETQIEELKKIVPAEFHSNLVPVTVDLNSEYEVTKLRERIIKTDGKLNHVITSIGGWRLNGPLSTVTVEDYKKTLEYLTLPHFIVYRTFAKHLASTSSPQAKNSYTFITGGSIEAKFFEPKASLIPIKACSIHGMYISALSEYRQSLCIMEYRVFTWVRKEADAKFAAKKSELECGHDYIGQFVPYFLLKNKSELYKLQTRSKGDEMLKQLQA